MRKWLRDAILGFVYFTGLLTPYMLLVVKMTPDQFLAWVVGVQAILVPPMSIGYGMLLRWLDGRGPVSIRGWRFQWARGWEFMNLTLGKESYQPVKFWGLVAQNPPAWKDSQGRRGDAGRRPAEAEGVTDFTKRPPTHPVKVPKLIRDRIPEFHARDGCHSVVKVVQDDRVFEGELMRKLTEEVVEFLDEPSDAEMADVLEVVRTMAILKGIIPAPDTPMQKAKREQNGGFEKRLLLTEFAWGPEP